MVVKLNDAEFHELMKQSPSTASDGGFQGFLVSLQERCVGPEHELALEPGDLERIPRYAFDYGNGGWENRLKAIFGRNLGPSLGR